jgi:glycosyltransferase involved in cell wall biosynthesis
MSIVHITAGAGHMYCGSCLRDNVLARALLDAGHDVVLVPTYTPAKTEGRDVSIDRVYMGGINVFLQEHVPLFRHVPRLLSRWLDSNALLRLATRRGVSVEPHELGRLTISMLRGVDGKQHRPVLELVRFLADDLSPEVVNLPNSLLISLAPALKRELGVPVVCTLQGEDHFLDSLGEPYRGEALALIRAHAASVDAFVAVSRYGADCMSTFLDIDPRRIHIVPLAADVEGHAPARLESEPFTIGYLARIAPEKGLHVLCDLYRQLRTTSGLPASRLLVAGYLAPEHRGYLESVRRQMADAGLGDHLVFLGELDRAGKLAFLQELSVLSVPSPKTTQKGLFLLEAMASGVPVVQPGLGVFTEIIDRTGGGVLTNPGDAEDWVRAIRKLWEDAERRKQLGAAAYDGVRREYGLSRSVDALMAVYHSLIGQPSGGRVSVPTPLEATEDSSVVRMQYR